MSRLPIIEKMGGRVAVAGLIRRRTAEKNTVTADTVRMWDSRGRIPGYAITQLMRAADNAGIDWTPDDFEPVAQRSRRKRSATA